MGQGLPGKIKMIIDSKKIMTVLAAVCLTLALNACSSAEGAKKAETPAAETTASADAAVNDPFEKTNRVIFSVNEGIDKAVLEPVARGYRYVAPKPVRQGLRNFLRNLKSPVVMGNQLLQGDLDGFGNASGRLIVNTLLGVGGLFDVADMGGIPYEPEDFGQTLAVWGVGNGPYIIIPIVGPSTVRDGTGLLVDSFADPVSIYLYNINEEQWQYARIAASVIDQREELLDVIDDLRRNSFDYYAAIRSTYYQRREALINDMDPSVNAGPSIPDYGN